ncbi:MAG: ABC transporter permease [Candidatus Limiplasma sp.]|nr:ABC transporter permease [Candidatus Limiplasma sp.]
MRAFLARNRLGPPLALLLAAAALALYAYFSLAAIPAQYQYLWAAPAPTTAATGGKAANDGLRDARLRMDALNEQLEGACEKTTLYAVSDGVSVQANVDGATAVTARLEALDDGAYALKPILLKGGRLLYPEEFQTGTRVALVDEKLAVALYNYAEPLGRTLLLGGQSYRIVGIVNDSRHVGDQREYSLYVPYRAMEHASVEMTALCVQTAPIPGAGGWSAFETATAALSAQGTCISLPKETMHAALPLRMVCCAFGLMALLFAVRLCNAMTRRLYRAWRLRMREQYALRLAPWLTARALPLLLGYAVCAFAFTRLFLLLIEPVYTFPEWIPKVLVEPNDISAAFWAVWQKQAALIELRSPELIRTRFFGELTAWACGALALAGGLLAARLSAALRPLLLRPDDEADRAVPDGAQAEAEALIRR